MDGSARRASWAPIGNDGHLGVEGPAHQAYWLLYVGFIVAPFVAGLDKFVDLLTKWEQTRSREQSCWTPGTAGASCVTSLTRPPPITTASRPSWRSGLADGTEDGHYSGQA